ncbi:glycoside hydrolase family 10 protein [Jaapia argillacea MUCL 33604]|uniref:Beta-xylanase n=1 Tax=Jaapia argillacea MUCL 33604 TaxID=933084 RepID=A0A067PAJ8_9AGAM|nr:glycoside hydrolase family 10 protein [Jaapia argillacea MUCL 33604]
MVFLSWLAGAISLLGSSSLYAVASPVGSRAFSFPETLKEAAYPRYFGNSLLSGHILNMSDPLFDFTAITQFSAATPENEMKWQVIEPYQNEFNFTGGDIVAAFAMVNNYTLRGHNLVWYSQLAPWVMNLTGTELESAMINHITVVMEHYKGIPYAWDVVNEPFNDDGTYREDIFYNELGPGYIETALRTARAADPHAKLYIYSIDYNIEWQGVKSDAMLSLAMNMTALGLLDGVGFESHFIVGETPGDIQQNMERFTAAGVEVAVTELDIRMPTPPTEANIMQQATDYSTVATACKAVAKCVGITTWGITDMYSWVPSTFPGYGYALLFDDYYQPKPATNATLAALTA